MKIRKRTEQQEIEAFEALGKDLFGFGGYPKIPLGYLWKIHTEQDDIVVSLVTMHERLIAEMKIHKNFVTHERVIQAMKEILDSTRIMK